jgi:hypothetical protein
MDHPDEIISASEIGQWTYCNRAWYLARAGETNRNTHAMARGEAQHQQHGRTVARSQTLRWLALALIALAFLLLVAAILSGLAG